MTLGVHHLLSEACLGLGTVGSTDSGVLKQEAGANSLRALLESLLSISGCFLVVGSYHRYLSEAEGSVTLSCKSLASATSHTFT